GGIALNWGVNQTATVNVMGGLVQNTAGVGINLNFANNAANTGFLNLDGGIAQAFTVNGGVNGTYVNFNGGTLRASANNATFMTGLFSAHVYRGGAVIDDGGFTVSVSQPLQATTGYGVNAIPLAGLGSGYTVPPTVTISGGSGSGA